MCRCYFHLGKLEIFVSSARSTQREPVSQPCAIGRDTGSSFVLCPKKKLVVLTLGSRVTIGDLAQYARLLKQKHFQKSQT